MPFFVKGEVISLTPLLKTGDIPLIYFVLR